MLLRFMNHVDTINILIHMVLLHLYRIRILANALLLSDASLSTREILLIASTAFQKPKHSTNLRLSQQSGWWRITMKRIHLIVTCPVYKHYKQKSNFDT